jgi:hypothetical protein
MEMVSKPRIMVKNDILHYLMFDRLESKLSCFEYAIKAVLKLVDAEMGKEISIFFYECEEYVKSRKKCLMELYTSITSILSDDNFLLGAMNEYVLLPLIDALSSILESAKWLVSYVERGATVECFSVDNITHHFKTEVYEISLRAQVILNVEAEKLVKTYNALHKFFNLFGESKDCKFFKSSSNSIVDGISALI